MKLAQLKCLGCHCRESPAITPERAAIGVLFLQLRYSVTLQMMLDALCPRHLALLSEPTEETRRIVKP